MAPSFDEHAAAHEAIEHKLDQKNRSHPWGKKTCYMPRPPFMSKKHPICPVICCPCCPPPPPPPRDSHHQHGHHSPPSHPRGYHPPSSHPPEEHLVMAPSFDERAAAHEAIEHKLDRILHQLDECMKKCCNTC
uniref:Uncharacterized protein n=1 Tax=Ascaris lumbricoides TaxID=6252 RepID=A0A0M3IKH6_ASCLU